MKQLPFITPMWREPSIVIVFIFLALHSCKKASPPVSPPDTTKYSITAKSGDHGSITPGGITKTAPGGNITYQISADAGYAIATLSIDGMSIPIAQSYAFTNVEENHTIAATFAQIVNATITAINGSVTATQAVVGGDITLTMIPNAGFHSDSLLINGVVTKFPTGTTTYTITNVTPTEIVKVYFSDSLKPIQLDSLNNILMGKKWCDIDDRTGPLSADTSTWTKINIPTCASDAYTLLLPGGGYQEYAGKNPCSGPGLRTGTYTLSANGKQIILTITNGPDKGAVWHINFKVTAKQFIGVNTDYGPNTGFYDKAVVIN